MTSAAPCTKKRIEVAPPREAINQASARENSIRQGHPCSLRLWRAVSFAQLVNDPASVPEECPPEEVQHRQRLIAGQVRWENTTSEEVLQRARGEIWKSWRCTCARHRV